MWWLIFRSFSNNINAEWTQHSEKNPVLNNELIDWTNISEKNELKYPLEAKEDLEKFNKESLGMPLNIKRHLIGCNYPKGIRPMLLEKCKGENGFKVLQQSYFK